MHLPLRTPRPPTYLLALAFAAVAGACDSLPGAESPASGATAAAVQAAPDSARDALVRRADNGRIMGSDSSTVWLVVLSDFQCPYCKVWHDETAPLIEREYVRSGRIRIAYLNLPISSHRNAWPAHESAMCAAEQGAFWPVADAIFATQRRWKDLADAPAFFDSLTSTLALDHARLRACIAGGQLRPLIKADLDRATRIGVGSTPSFFIGTRVLVGAQPYEAFKRALDEALAEARTAKPTG